MGRKRLARAQDFFTATTWVEMIRQAHCGRRLEVFRNNTDKKALKKVAEREQLSPRREEGELKESLVRAMSNLGKMMLSKGP